MQVTLAPLEGITGYLFRNAHAAVFGAADKYITPFLAPTQSLVFSHREMAEVLPEHNDGLPVVPQLIVNCPENFIWAARELQAMGYGEVNLNLGCPSGTVVSKGKGSGFLAFPDRLDAFFDEVFSSLTVNISVKTRVGKLNDEDWGRLLEIFSRYPICELTVHPRVQADLYRGKPRMDTFRLAAETCPLPLCYNGDIFSSAHMDVFAADYPHIDRVMVGRGIVANPALIRQLKGGPSAGKEEIRAFHDRLYADYCRVLPGQKPVLARMKELWAYLSFSFEDREKAAKPLRKATRLSDYEEAVAQLLRDHEVIPGGTFDPGTL